uniref:hypothetical protein n=1 Tax=Nemalion vermiculare TaxID=935621 RepID=UPI00257ECFAB|nr:hypothetical protein QU266_pgp115 [Nemalion vermiculare]WGV34361.1 hypothetical protein [Nemalion vermiculare]
MILLYNYIDFPKYWLHKIKTSHKILSIIFYISVLPFCSTNLLLIQYIIIVLFSGFLLAKYPGSYRKFIMSLILILIVFILVAILTPSASVGLYSISIPYQIKYMYCKLKCSNMVTIIYHNYLYLYIPSTLLRSYLIVNNYLSLYYTVVITTSFEDLIVNLVKYNANTPNKSAILKKTVLVTLIASDLIYTLGIQIKNIADTILLRGIKKANVLNEMNKWLYLICFSYCKYLSQIINDMTCNIFSRNLERYDYKLWFIF